MSDISPAEFVAPPLWPGFEYFKHQLVAIEWLLKLLQGGVMCGPYASFKTETMVNGALLADEMGAGKTIEMLGAIRMLSVRHTLISVPNAVVQTWLDISVRAGFQVFTVRGTGGGASWVQVNPSAAAAASAIYVCSHATFIHKPHLTAAPAPSHSTLHSNSASSSSSGHWDLAVIDEAHVIRNPSTKLYKAVAAVFDEVKLRVMITATPLVNKEKDLITLLAVLGVPTTPSCMYTPSYHDPLIQRLMLHRSMDTLRAAVAAMPPKPTISNVRLPFACLQERAYYKMLFKKLEDEMVLAFHEHRMAEGLELLLRLRQCSLSPELVPKDLVDKYGVGEWPAGKPSSKMLEILRRVNEEPDSKFLVFCWFRDEMDLTDAMLTGEGIGVEQYHGSLSQAQRNDVLDRACKPACQVLLVQIRSGGVGLNLQEFNRVIFTSPYWTAATMDQAIGRAVRIGQSEVVQVMYLLMDDEEALDEDIGCNIDTYTKAIATAKGEMCKRFFDMLEQPEPEPEPEPAPASAAPFTTSTPEIQLTRPRARAVLGVTASSDDAAIRKAYHRLAMQWHPDKNSSEEGKRMFHLVNKAYEVLVPPPPMTY